MRSLVVLAMALLLIGCARVGQPSVALPAHADEIAESEGSPDVQVMEHDAMPEPAGNSGLEVQLTMQRRVWGEWERPSFEYCVENTSDRFPWIENPDQGRGIEGKLIYLRDPKGRVRSFGHDWLDPKKYPVHFRGSERCFLPGKIVYQQTDVRPSDYFGPLMPGEYTMQLVVPSGHLAVNGKPTGQIVSTPMSFQIVELSNALRRVMEQTSRDPAGVSLEASQRTVKRSKEKDLELKLANNSNKTIQFAGYFQLPDVILDCEFFAGDGQWHGENRGVCGVGLTVLSLKPGESTFIRTSQPYDFRFVRYTLRVADEGRQDCRQIVSPSIELADP